jgi:hypothetical protein
MVLFGILETIGTIRAKIWSFRIHEHFEYRICNELRLPAPPVAAAPQKGNLPLVQT